MQNTASASVVRFPSNCLAEERLDQRRQERLLMERLPFTVKIVHTEAELQKAIHIRHAAYSRHVPAFAETLKAAEQMDMQEGVAILLAESKLDGAPLGTMRIQTNQYGPLNLEQSVTLPDWLAQRSLAEATRLGVTDQRIGRLVKTVLFKSFYQYCVTNDIEWMVISGRAPVDRQYDQLLFNDVFPGQGYMPLRHVGNIPHRILSFDVAAAKRRWTEANHPLHNFVFQTYHPDIHIGLQEITPIQ